MTAYADTTQGDLATSKPRISIDKYTLVAVTLIAVLTLVYVIPALLYYLTFSVATADHWAHVKFAYEFLEAGRPRSAHFLYQLTYLGAANVLPWANPPTLILILNTLFNLGMAYLVYGLLARTFGNPRSFIASVGLAGLAVSAIIAGPINIASQIFEPSGLWEHSYLRYNNMHSPTYLMLKPAAFALWLMILRVWRPRYGVVSNIWIIATAALVVLCGFVKPNYLFALVPGLGLIAAYALLRRRPDWINWRLLIGVGLVGSLTLAAQYAMGSLLYDPADAVQIVFEPLGLFTAWGVVDDWFWARIFLSVAFPVAVYVVYFREARSNVPLNFAWLFFLVAFAQGVFLLEAGDRSGHGNFIWGSMICLFILFVTSLLFFLKRSVSFTNGIRFRLGVGSVFLLIVLALQVASGIDRVVRFMSEFTAWANL